MSISASGGDGVGDKTKVIYKNRPGYACLFAVYFLKSKKTPFLNNHLY